MKAITAQERTDIERNLFQEARAAIRDWSTFPWHRDESGRITATLVQSSQALAIDFFGTIDQVTCKNEIFRAWSETWNFSTRGNWTLELEKLIDADYLCEPRSTQVDAAASDSRNLVFFECKFTEKDGGSCSQHKPIARGANKGLRQCNGNYELQVNPVNGLSSRCALTAKGVKYWNWIPEVMSIANDSDHRPCPFAGPWYQWMRNLVACAAIAKDTKKNALFIVVYAAGDHSAHFPMKRNITSENWKHLKSLVSTGSIYFDAVSYEDLLEVALKVATNADKEILLRLRSWLAFKTTRAAGNAL